MFNNISYNVVVERFKAFADGHFLIRRFTHGQVDQTDLDKDQLFPWMHVAPVEVRAAAGARVFTFDVIFADIPRDKEDKTDYQKESISDCIRLAEDLLSEIQNGQVVFSSLVEVEGESTITPFIEEWTHTLSGCTLALTISVPNDYSACDIPADWSIGGGGSGTPPSPFPSLILKVNNIDNVVQNVLDLVDGDNVTIEDLGDGRIRINSTGGGGGGSAAWGAITGTLSNQTDLQTALNLKANISSLGAAAFSNDYNDLSNLPTIPSIDGLVPYTGASQNVNLGEQKLTTESATDFTEMAPSYVTVRNDASTKYTQIEKTGVSVVDTAAGDTMNMNAGGLTFPDASSQYTAAVNADWNATSGLAEILNKPTLPPVIGDMLKSVYDTDADGVVDASETVQITVRNSTGSTLLKGQIVYLSGATGNRPNAVLADASTEATSSKTIGFVIEDIADNADGQVAVSGSLHTLDTSSFTAGDTLWLSETAGAWQANTPPAEPAHAVFLGYVARSHPTLGRVIIAIQNGYELNELHGVLVSGEANRQGLYYNSTSGLWQNRLLEAADMPTGIDAARIGSGTVSNTEFGYLDGVTSAIQTQLNNKKDTVTYGNVYAVTVGASSTVYAAVSGLTTFNATETNRHFAVPVAGTLKNLYVKMSGTQSATGTLVITMRNNATSSGVTVTVANADGASPTKSDNTNTLAINAGDLLAIQLVNNATVASASVVSISFVIERS